MRKKLAYLFVCVSMLVGFNVGCGNKTDSVSVNNEGNSITIQPAATITGVLQETETPVPTPTETVVPASSATPIPTATNTPLPTVTNTPTPSPTPTVTNTPTPSPVPTVTGTPTPSPTPLYTYQEFDKMDMWATTNVNMRTLPSTDGEKILLVNKGSRVTVLGQCVETGWYKAEFNGKSGYICNDYLTGVKPTPSPTPSPKPTATPKPTRKPGPTPTPRVVNFTGDDTITIRMVGDALIHSGIYKQCEQSDGSYNADKLFENVADVIQAADIAIINQETILVANEEDYSSYPQFGSPYAIGQGALDAGFNVVAHATNHTLDKGVSGVRQTLDFWRNKDITVLGIHENAEESDIDYVSCEGITISFVNYTYGLNGLESTLGNEKYVVDLLSDKNIEKTVATAKKNSDLMIAVLHVGTEYVYTPSDYAIKQVDRFIDAGADIVLCAHPHVVETYGMRTTKNNNTALVYYSLGNFVSYQNKAPRMIGGMADITIGLTKQADASYKVEIVDYDMVPLITHLQSRGKNTTYFLSDYTEELCSKHVYFKEENLSLSDLYDMYDAMVNEAAYLVD